MNIVIPMGGLGTRFKEEGFDLPKPLIQVNGKTLIEHSISTLNLPGKFIFITRKYVDPLHNEMLSEILKKVAPDSIEIVTESVTRGSVETCLLSQHLIDNEEELIITNCDQITDWEAGEFLDFISDAGLDGAVVTYNSTNPKNSFAVLDQNRIVSFVEKKAVSNLALIGLHYWKRGKDFVRSAKMLMSDFEELGRPECYISESYNYLIKEGLNIKPYQIENNQYISLGTPYDLSIYSGKVKEFHTDKPKTIICDLDGTLIKHAHRFSDIIDSQPELLPGVIDKINQWDSQGHTIILMTARKESAREMTEKHLRSLGLCWNHLIMGVTSGNRILINDKLNRKHPDRAIGINIVTDSGFKKTNWEDFGL